MVANESINTAYEFAGCHLVASYLGCDKLLLSDNVNLIAAMNVAITKCGATLLAQNCHVFENGGITAVMLLSESHASIHTYPEHGACFVDIFTCGSTCSPEIFDATLRAYLRPANVASQKILRDQVICFAPSEQANNDQVLSVSAGQSLSNVSTMLA